MENSYNDEGAKQKNEERVLKHSTSIHLNLGIKKARLCSSFFNSYRS